jgi:hypothetical protein
VWSVWWGDGSVDGARAMNAQFRVLEVLLVLVPNGMAWESHGDALPLNIDTLSGSQSACNRIRRISHRAFPSLDFRFVSVNALPSRSCLWQHISNNFHQI